MPRRVFDTNYLCGHWHKVRRDVATVSQAKAAGRQLLILHGSDGIFTPVKIEFLAGARDSLELRLFQAYLSAFPVLDNGETPSRDWTETTRIAQRIPTNGKPRQLADCLIRATANRLHCEVLSGDKQVQDSANF